MARLAYGSDVRGRKAKSAFKARILRRLGDYLIHQLRAAEPRSVIVSTSPACRHDVDMGHRAFRATRSQSANFNRAYGKSLIAVVAKLSEKEVKTTTLKDWPDMRSGHLPVVLFRESDRPHAETLPKIVEKQERILQETSTGGGNP